MSVIVSYEFIKLNKTVIYGYIGNVDVLLSDNCGECSDCELFDILMKHIVCKSQTIEDDWGVNNEITDSKFRGYFQCLHKK